MRDRSRKDGNRVVRYVDHGVDDARGGQKATRSPVMSSETMPKRRWKSFAELVESRFGESDGLAQCLGASRPIPMRREKAALTAR